MGWVWRFLSTWLWVFSLSCSPKRIFPLQLSQFYYTIIFTWHFLEWWWWYTDGGECSLLFWLSLSLSQVLWTWFGGCSLHKYSCPSSRHNTGLNMHSCLIPEAEVFFSCFLLPVEFWFPPVASDYSFCFPGPFILFLFLMGNRSGVWVEFQWSLGGVWMVAVILHQSVP